MTLHCAPLCPAGLSLVWGECVRVHLVQGAAWPA